MRYSTLLLLLLTTPAFAAEPVYSWQSISSDPDRVYLYRDGKQIGGWCYRANHYRSFDGTNWGDPTASSPAQVPTRAQGTIPKVDSSPRLAESPLVEKYLHAGEYAKGEQVLERSLAASPKDDQIRFGLGVLQVFHGVNRFGQSLYEHGVKSENQQAPFLKLPIPKNPNPTPITYTSFRRILEALQRDLERAEATLAGVADDKVTLPLRLAPIRFDFDNDGQATDTFLNVLKTVLRTDLQFLKGDAEFLVHFDRGDVAWLRAYCHLLMGLIDFALALDLEDAFDQESEGMFAEPKRRKPAKPKADVMRVVAVKEPARLGHFRQHLLAVCQLNRETWRHIRAETDNDREWLPNAKQKSVIGMPVNDEQIDSWLAMMTELEGLLEGRKVIPNMLLKLIWQKPKFEGGLNVKTLLEDPPEVFDFKAIEANGPTAKYLDNKNTDLNIEVLFRMSQLFDSPYMAWFN